MFINTHPPLFVISQKLHNFVILDKSHKNIRMAFNS